MKKSKTTLENHIFLYEISLFSKDEKFFVNILKKDKETGRQTTWLIPFLTYEEAEKFYKENIEEYSSFSKILTNK